MHCPYNFCIKLLSSSANQVNLPSTNREMYGPYIFLPSPIHFPRVVILERLPRDTRLRRYKNVCTFILLKDNVNCAGGHLKSAKGRTKNAQILAAGERHFEIPREISPSDSHLPFLAPKSCALEGRTVTYGLWD